MPLVEMPLMFKWPVKDVGIAKRIVELSRFKAIEYAWPVATDVACSTGQMGPRNRWPQPCLLTAPMEYNGFEIQNSSSQRYYHQIELFEREWERLKEWEAVQAAGPTDYLAQLAARLQQISVVRPTSSSGDRLARACSDLCPVYIGGQKP